MILRQLFLAMLGMVFAYFVRRAVSQAGANSAGAGTSGPGANSHGRSQRNRSGRAGANRTGTNGGKLDGKMVRDRVCNTYLPEEKALTTRQDGSTQYFCSEACRQSYLADRAAS